MVFIGFTSVLASCVTTTQQGSGSSAVTGAAAGGTSVDSSVERCNEPFGTLAVDDGRSRAWYGSFSSATGVNSIEPLLRLAVQQSNCFVLTSIGNASLDSRISAITQQQRNSGEFRAGSNQQAGQRVAADYFMEPAIIVNNDSLGGIGAAAGSLLGSSFGALAGSLETKNSVVTLSLFDIRSQVQISASEGSSTATNFGAAVAGFGGGSAGGLSGFSRTPEGKATVAAFLDAYNQMVISLRNYSAQQVRGGLGRGGTLTVGN
ncbi:MAG: hypothetical protein AAGC79_14955 [Pseudomonadota bacterium]